MPARDIYHDAVKNASIQQGWIITDDSLHLKLVITNIF
ncbi:MAG: xisH family protein [Nostoc sp. JL33]|nr:xisH family protein [Nostoc sp. JL33]